jgi:hypothetical protein
MPQTATKSPSFNRVAERVTPQSAHQALKSNPNAFLVCAYDDEEKCRKNYLEGALTLREFQVREDSLPKDSEILLYCA